MADTENNSSLVTVEDAFLMIKEALSSLEADKIPRLVEMFRDELAKTSTEGSSKKSRVLLYALGLIKQTLEESLLTKEVAVALDSGNAIGNTVVTVENNVKEQIVYVKSVHTRENTATFQSDEVPNISDDDHEDRFGVVFIDAYESLFGTFRTESGHLEIIHKLSVVPPKRWGRGTLKYASLRVMKHRELIKKPVEATNKLFINPATGQVNVSGGLILGGSHIGASFFHLMSFDSRVAKKVLDEVDVSFRGAFRGEEGLKEVIERWCTLRF